MLNQEQEKAVFATDAYIFLLAGAGSGKTRVIVERIKYLLKSGVKPDQILAITFTKKAAKEMVVRINQESMKVCTFHKYCYDILSKDMPMTLVDQKHIPFSEEETLQFSTYKNHNYQTKKPKGFDRYQTFLKSNHLKDYDDLLLEALNQIKEHAYTYIFIDEFQDTNPLQYQLLKAMFKPGVFGFAVGDPDQSIYAFRGTDMQVIQTYIKDFNAKRYTLTKNYRSYQSVLSCANHLIKHNKHRFKKALIPTHVENGAVWLEKTNDVFKKVIEIVKIFRQQSYEVAILYRFHYLANGLKQALEDNYIFDVYYLSMHEAKGLEFDNIMILGADLMPHLKDNQYKMVEEERRLLFVAITRARHHVCFIYQGNSLFIKEIKC